VPLHHQNERVDGDKQEDEVLKGRRTAQLVASVAQAAAHRGHVEAHRLGVEGELHTGFLVLVDLGLGQGSLALLLESDDDQSHENVDEEEGKDDEVDDVEDGVVEFVGLLGAVVLRGDVQRMLEDLRPALARLHGEQGEKGEYEVVVVELPLHPDTVHDDRVALVVVVELALALLLRLFGDVVAVEELAGEELHPDHREDEHEEHVDDHDVEDVLERVDDTVEDGLKLGYAVDGLEGPQDAQDFERLHGGQVLGGLLVAAHDDREEGAGDDDEVEGVPQVAEVGARVADHAQVKHLEDHFGGEDGGEAVVDVVEDDVADVVLVDGVLGGQGQGADQNDGHDELVESRLGHEFVDFDSGSGKW